MENISIEDWKQVFKPVLEQIIGKELSKKLLTRQPLEQTPYSTEEQRVKAEEEARRFYESDTTFHGSRRGGW